MNLTSSSTVGVGEARVAALVGEHHTDRYVEWARAFIRHELCAELFGRPFIDTPAPGTTTRHP